MVTMIVNERQGISRNQSNDNKIENKENKNTTFHQFMKDHRPLIQKTLGSLKNEGKFQDFDKTLQKIDPSRTINSNFI